METSARVVRLEGELAWVRTESPSSCGACGGKGCGSSLFARLWHPREPEYAVLNPIAAEVGEAVVVGIEEGALWRAALSGYLMPLFLLLSGAFVGAVWSEPAAIAGGLLGLVAAGVWLKLRPAMAPPVILRRGGTACASG